MTLVHAYAATQPGGRLQPFEYQLGSIGPNDVDIAVEHCGICYSDLSMLENEWGISIYPIVPGHEVIGRIKSVGELVKNLKAGDLVGLGWHAGYCMACLSCMSGNHNMCSQAVATIKGHHGGFADTVRAAAPSVVKLPAGLDPKEAGPLLCAGITVFTPLIQNVILPTATVGVIGIGGLGHLAVKFLRAWGCEVIAFTSNESKKKEALELGAHQAIDSRNPSAIQSMNGKLDLVLSTVNATMDWNTYLGTLKPNGVLHLVGVVLETLELNMLQLLFGQRSVSTSSVGSPATIASMLEFAQRHHIEPMTEHYPMSEVNAALDHLRSGKSRYRIVLDADF